MGVDRDDLFIGGGWVKPSTSNRFTVRNAATEEVLGSVPEATGADVDWAIGSPFGGVKDSGIGREFGPETLSSYLNLKSMYVSG